MKKVFFRQNKRILATVCSAAILFGSFACLGSAQVSAETTKPSLSGEVTYDFENGSDYLDFGIQYNKTLGEVSVVDDGTGNKCLKLYNACVWEGMIVNFPYVLENNTEYVITYKVRSDEGVKVRQDGDATAKYTAGIYVGKSTGVTESGVGLSDADAKRIEVKNYLNYRLSTLYGTGTGQYEQIPTAWTTQKKTVKTSDSAVDENFKYLCFNFVATDRKDSNGYSTLYIDDIHIQKISTDSAEYNFESGNEYLDFGIRPNKTLGDISVVDDATESGNKCLKLYNRCDWEGMIVNFPYVLENNTNYVISYRVRSDEGVKVRQDGNATAKYTAGIYVGKSTGVTESGAGIVDNAQANRIDITQYIQNRLSTLYGTGTGQYEQISTTWTTQKKTVKTSDSAVDESFKYLCFNFVATDRKDSNGYSTLYIDDIKIEKVVSLSFGEDADAIITSPGSKVPLPTPKAKLGYTFDGWYDADKNPLGNAGTEIICPDVDTTYSANWVKNESYEINFDDGSLGSALYTTTTPAVVDDPDGSTNKVLELAKKSGNTYGITLPVELEPNTEYTVSFDYKVKLADGTGNIQLNPTGGKADAPTYSGSYIALADNNGTMIEDGTSPMALLFGDGLKASDNDATVGGNIWNTPNKISNTDWVTRTYSFTTAADSVGQFAMLKLVYYYEVSAESSVYFDNVYVQKTPTVTFDSNGGSEIASIKVAPNTVITPGCPIRAGYTFKGWYVNGEYAGFDKLTMPKENVTYTAEWKRVLSVGNVDADENNIIDGSDLTQLKKILLGSVTEYEITLADCTGNGTVDILDLVRLKKYLASPSEITLGKTVDGATGYQLVWNEEFDGSALDSNTFIANQIQGKVDGITFTDEQVDVSDGTLKLWAVQNGDGTVACAKGVTTDNTMNFKHGYVEVRAKLPYLGQGEWPAIWSTSSSAKLAGTQNERSLEIDLAENMGGGILQAQIHNWGPDKNINTDDYRNLINDNSNLDLKKSSNEFHTYGMLWTEESVKFYLDGVQYASYTFPNDATMSAEVANQLISLRINNGFNTDSKMELSGLNNNAVEVDYVRLYQIPEKSILISK